MISNKGEFMEEWKKIDGYEHYWVSSCGRVYSTKISNYLKPWLDGKHRYLQVQLCKNNTTKKFSVHQLVANAFVPNPDKKPEVNHIDYNTLNNCVENLEWSTRKENMQHAFKKFSPVRNFRKCYLLVDGVCKNKFQSVDECCRYAHEHYGLSYTGMSKYRTKTQNGTKYEIITETQTTIPQGSTPEDRPLVEVQAT